MRRCCVVLLATFAFLPASRAFSPQPTSVRTNAGVFSYTTGTRLFYKTRRTTRAVENSLQPLAEALAGELELITGIKPVILVNTGGNTPGPGDISLDFAPISSEFASSEEDENQSYTLEVTDTVKLRSQYFKGVAYGSTTLLQAMVDTAGVYTVPQLTISDAPAAAYRAVMIDAARQPSSIGAIKQVVRLARQYKLRYLHLHLTDDQNFTFPFAPVTSKLSGNFTYARSDLVDLAVYADARGVTIIPELELPGHSSKIRASGYLNRSSNDADVAHPNNFAKNQAIIDDMLLVFPNSPYFHIGGDESGAGSALIPFLGAMNNHLRGKPAGQKKRLMVWEGFHRAPTNDLPATGDNRVVVFSWESSYNAPWDLLNSGYQIINGSWKPLYVVGSAATTRYPHVSQRMWSPEVLHTWDKDTFMHWEPGRPVFEDRGPGDTNRNDGVWNANWINRQGQVMGGQMLSWEQNEETIVTDLLPRLPVMADRLWNPQGSEDYATFKARLDAVRERSLSIVRPVEVLPLSLVVDSPLNQDYRTYSGSSVTITLRNRTKIAGTIRYTTGAFHNDRTAANFFPVPEPTASSTAYTAPFSKTGGFGIRARLYRTNGAAVEGDDWQHYNNWENRVKVTEYEVSRRPLKAVPDFTTYSTNQITRVYDLPSLHGPYLLEKPYGQKFDMTLQVPSNGSYKFVMQTRDGRASMYFDLDKDGVWDANEKLIADTEPSEVKKTNTVTLTKGDYRLRVDHASGAIAPVLILTLNGPGTSGKKDVSGFIKLPEPVVPEHNVRFIYLVSADREAKPEYIAAIEHAAHDMQSWYARQLNGATFKLADPVVEVIKTDRNALWFNSHANGDQKANWGFNNTLDEMRRLRHVQPGKDRFIWVIYSDGPGNNGRAFAGFAYLPEDDLLGLVGQHPTQKSTNRWIAGMGHELGHALGLPHPKDTRKHNNALMWAGFYQYPHGGCYLTEEDKQILQRSPFIAALPSPKKDSTVRIPRIVGDYVHVYKPRGDVFPGPKAANLIAGQFYEDWVPNDHCFIKGDSGRWHAFGITHPLTDVSNVHAGEHLLFHAIAPPGALKESLKEGSWQDLRKVLPPSERPGEMPAIHAPWILKRDGLFHMVYGPTPIRYATSKDLSNWTPRGNLRGAPSGRDPQIFVWKDIYHLIVCGVHDVRVSTSRDFETWTGHDPILTMQPGFDPESPSIVRYHDTFYLFVCGWDGVWDQKEIQGAYQHKTYVYQSDDPLKFELRNQMAVLDAHAPEIFQDEAGDWFISSVEWPHRGVSIARLVWE